jgi:hypothetical protein
MFVTFLDKIQPNRIARKLAERLDDPKRYREQFTGGQPLYRCPVLRDIVDGTDFSVIRPWGRQ